MFLCILCINSAFYLFGGFGTKKKRVNNEMKNERYESDNYRNEQKCINS